MAIGVYSGVACANIHSWITTACSAKIWLAADYDSYWMLEVSRRCNNQQAPIDNLTPQDKTRMDESMRIKKEPAKCERPAKLNRGDNVGY